MTFQSEIRQSQINQLLEKVENGSYGHYLLGIKLDKLRGFVDQRITFQFPVTAIIGPNGGGKTTVLGAASLIYNDVKPRRFFTKSGRFDNSMQDWKVEYQVIDKSVDQRAAITRTASYKSYKWSRNALNRQVTIFGISRTVPPSEKIEYSKFASNTFDVDESRIQRLSPQVAEAVGKILGKDVREYSMIKIDEAGNVSFLTGRTSSGVEYSEFHFGAGESSIIRMVFAIESTPENSLVLIEEIENGLHPVATIRMVEYLIEVALRKKNQFIFTTHSNEALHPLPDKAIWVAISNKTYQGKLDIKSLRAITGQISAQMVIFVEDDFSKCWLESIIRSIDNVDIEMFQAYAMQGDGTAVSINRHHNSDPSIRNMPSLCFIDGDSRQAENPGERVFRLPGQSPESYIYDKVVDKLDIVIGQLTVCLHKKFEQQQFVREVIRDVRLTTRDPHLLFSQVAKRLGFLSEALVVSAFIVIWCQYYEDELAVLASHIKSNMRQ